MPRATSTASIVAAPGAPVAVTAGVVGALDNDTVVTVMSVDEESEQL